MRKAFREKYGSKLFALGIIIMMITVVYPTLITNAKNPSQLSAYDDDWNDISTFASDIDEDQNGNHVMKTIVSRPAIINKISDIERNSTKKTIEVNSTVLVIIGVERSYSEFDSNAIYNFVKSGGKVIIAGLGDKEVAEDGSNPFPAPHIVNCIEKNTKSSHGFGRSRRLQLQR